MQRSKRKTTEGERLEISNKIGNSKGTFHPKIEIIKDKNDKDLIETEEIKKRWKEYTEDPYKKDINHPDNHHAVVSHSEPNILECEVKWALGSTAVNKASECNGIPEELFKILKDYVIQVLHSICQEIWKTQQ